MKKLIFLILALFMTTAAFAYGDKWDPSYSYKRQIKNYIASQNLPAITRSLKSKLSDGMNPDFKLFADQSILLALVMKFHQPRFSEELKKVISLLWLKGADLDWYYPARGLTPLMAAAGNCDVDLMRYLIARGADYNKTILVNSHYESVLHYATICKETTDLMVQFKADFTQGGRCITWGDRFSAWYNEEEYAGLHQTLFRIFHQQVDSMQCCYNTYGAISDNAIELCDEIFTIPVFIPENELKEKEEPTWWE